MVFTFRKKGNNFNLLISCDERDDVVNLKIDLKRNLEYKNSSKFSLLLFLSYLN